MQKMSPNARVASPSPNVTPSPQQFTWGDMFQKPSATNYDVASKFYSPDSTWDIGGKKYIVDYGTPQEPKAVVIPTGF